MRKVARGCGLGLELRPIIGGLETFKGKLALNFCRMLAILIETGALKRKQLKF